MLTSWLSHRSGGLWEAVSRLSCALRDYPDCAVAAFGLEDQFTAEETKQWDGTICSFPVRGPNSFGYAPQLAAALKSAGLDILHTHGLWMYYSIASAAWIRSAGRPCIISPHGMLDAWALQNSARKKQVAFALYERAHLNSAACLHALCEAEAAAMRSLGLRNPICIVPNGLVTTAQAVANPPAWHDRVPSSAKILLYVGRIHPKKGLPNLLRAWRTFATGVGSDWHLAIAGWDQAGHEKELQMLVGRLEAPRVHFLGPLFGAEKHAAYIAAEAFILPSVSEGLPMVVLEAWSYGLPVLMTRACNLPEGFGACAALEIGTDSESICAGLDLLAHLSDEQRRAMGNNGRRLCTSRFSQAHTGRMMQSVYRWLLNLEPPPDCVRDPVTPLASTEREKPRESANTVSRGN